MTEFNTGGIDFKKLKSKLTLINKQLKKIKSHYIVDIPKDQTDEALYTNEPYQFIKVHDSDSDALIALQTYAYENTGWYGGC